MGFCYAIYRDPLITVAEVKDATSGGLVAQVRIRDVVYRGHRVSARWLVEVTPPVKGVTVEGEDLRCDVPCGFAGDEGDYQLTIHHVDYKDTTFALNAGYREVDGGCPTTSSGGTVLRLRMSKP